MNLNRLRVTLVVLVALGLGGAGLGWLASGTDKKGRTVPVAAAEHDTKRPSAPTREPEVDRGKRKQVEKARDKIHALTLETEKADEELTKQLLKARDQLIDLEVALLDAEEAARAARASGKTEQQLRKEVAAVRRSIVTLYLTGPPAPCPSFDGNLKEWEELAKEIERKLQMRKTATRKCIDLRKKIARLEETIRQLERNRDRLHAQSERTRDEILDRIK